MRALGAFLVDYVVAGRVDLLDVQPPFDRHFFLLQIIPQTLLPQVLKNDLSALNRRVAWLYRAVFSTGVAVAFDVELVAFQALPENVARREVYLRGECVVELRKVLQEVEGPVAA